MFVGNIIEDDETTLVEKISYELYSYLKNIIFENIIIFNIGTSNIAGDAIGPSVGTFLKENNSNFKCVGDLNSPIHAKNVAKEIDKIDKDKYIVAIDSCVGQNNSKIGDIFIRIGSVSPGRGVGKKLPRIGDIKIIIVTSTAENEYIYYELNKFPLRYVFRCAQIITKAFIDVENKKKDNINNIFQTL